MNENMLAQVKNASMSTYVLSKVVFGTIKH